MLSTNTRELANEFYNLLMDAGCDTDLATALSYIDVDHDVTRRMVAQAYITAACKAAAAHIENCYDTPGLSNQVSRYADWLAAQIKEASALAK